MDPEPLVSADGTPLAEFCLAPGFRAAWVGEPVRIEGLASDASASSRPGSGW